MVDILLGSYNGEKYIAEQIESIINQEYTEWNLFIRDDGSNDRTIEIIESYIVKFPQKIHLIKDNKNNLGTKLNFNELIKYSKNKYCMFCDQDDVWLPNKIKITLQKMLETENESDKDIPILIHTDLKVVDEKLNIINSSIWNYMKLDPRRNSLNRILVKTTVTGCTVMINSKLRDLIGEIPKDCVMHDYWVTLIAASCGKIDFLNESTILYRQHGNNQVGSGKSSIFKRLTKDLLNMRYMFNILDAKILYTNYSSYMNNSNRQILLEFINLEKSSFLKKRYIIIKNKYLTNNIFRNIKILLLC